MGTITLPNGTKIADNQVNVGTVDMPIIRTAPVPGGSSAGVADTTAPVAPIDTTRYARTVNTNDQKINDLNTKLSSTVGETPDLAKITADKRALAEGQVNAVTAEFNRVIDQQNNTNDSNNARVRASNISSGLGGSDFGTARAVDQEQKNNKQLDLINQEKTAKISSILSGVDDRATEAYQAQRADYIKSLGDDLARVKAAKEEDKSTALNSIKGLAANGVSIEKLKEQDPSTYNTILQEYGGSQMDLDSEWNNALPDNMKTQYENKIIQGPNGNAILFRYGLNPLTNTVEKKEYELGASYNDLNGVKPVTVDGRLFALSTDKDGNQVARPLTQKQFAPKSGGGGGKVVRSGKATFTPTQISGFGTELESSKTANGGDGKYVNPDTYLQAYQAWTDPSVGGLAKDFLTQFPPAKYVNPKNDTLPEYLRSGSKSSTTVSKKGTTAADL